MTKKAFAVVFVLAILGGVGAAALEIQRSNRDAKTVEAQDIIDRAIERAAGSGRMPKRQAMTPRWEGQTFFTMAGICVVVAAIGMAGMIVAKD